MKDPGTTGYCKGDQNRYFEAKQDLSPNDVGFVLIRNHTINKVENEHETYPWFAEMYITRDPD